MSVDVAVHNLQRFGNYPTAMTFANNDNVSDLADAADPKFSAAFDPKDGIKRHAACDECRKRKLKCSGEPSGCTRCIKQKLGCHYSEQKQMGRPRKKQKMDIDAAAAEEMTSPPRLLQPAPESPSYLNRDIDPDLLPTLVNEERRQFENICRAPLAQTMRVEKYTYEDPLPGLQSTPSDSNHSQNGAPTPNTDYTIYPTDVAQWPDFSTLDMLPLPVDDKYDPFEHQSIPADPDVNPQALSNLPSVPACPCLPNLYLTLSTLSTLSSFPFNQQTIQTIDTACRTAKGVIYCPVCPQKFDSGSANLMLGTTLLNVLADQWNRLRKLGVDDLRKAFSKGPCSTALSTREGEAWRTFARQLLRAYVFGDASIPTPPTERSLPSTNDQTSNPFVQVTLMSLCEALTRRQRQWHRLDEMTDEFADRVTPDLAHGHGMGHAGSKADKFLCLDIAEHAKALVAGLDGPIHCH